MATATIKPERKLKTIWYMNILFFYAAITVMMLLFFLFSDIYTWILISVSAGFLVSLIIVLTWIPAGYKALEYYVEEDSVKMKGGVFWRKHVTVPNKKITNIDIVQGPFERYLKIGTLHIQTAGAGGQQGQKAELKISGVRNMEKIRDIIADNLYSGYTAGGVREKNSSTLIEDISTGERYAGEKEILLEILQTLKSMDEKLKK